MNGEIEITIKRIVNIEYMIKHMTDFIRYNSECSKKRSRYVFRKCSRSY